MCKCLLTFFFRKLCSAEGRRVAQSLHEQAKTNGVVFPLALRFLTLKKLFARHNFERPLKSTKIIGASFLSVLSGPFRSFRPCPLSHPFSPLHLPLYPPFFDSQKTLIFRYPYDLGTL